MEGYNLYLITLANYHRFYVIGKDAQAAYDKLRRFLDREDIFFENGRKLLSVEVVAETYEGSLEIFEPIEKGV